MSTADLKAGEERGRPVTALSPEEPIASPAEDGHADGANGRNGARSEEVVATTPAVISAPPETSETAEPPAAAPAVRAPKPKPLAPRGPRPTLDLLIKTVQAYNSGVDLDALRKAYAFAETAHEGQFRNSGEPYITHPLQVAIILAEMRLDLETLQAALMHDVIEDTPVTYDQIKDRFGPVVAHLVEGVTKLSTIPTLRQPQDGRAEDKGQADKRQQEEKRQREAQQAENLRKMFLAMFDDPRVVLIKLADRLHNMRTLDAIQPQKQWRIALQTLEIYAPLANRLGMWRMKGELEDLAFSYLNTDRYNELADLLKETKTARDRYLKRVIHVLEENLHEAGIQPEIKGRVKHIYSLYQKMERKRRPVEHIYDLLAVRIIVDSVKDCYAALGVIHSLWPPIPGEFDDYIARPKESMYQSLHTAVWALDNKPLEIQIRTHEMHEMAEYGIAAHWRYKEQRGGKRDTRYEQKIAWLRRLMDWRHEVESAQDFVESLKSDVFQEHIYVFTPQGDIVELPSGATPIDFAYRIHTDLGHQCGGAIINDRIATLDTPLENGAIVKIIKDKNRIGPSRDWLQSDRFIKTATARSKVRQWFSRQRREEKITQGRAILDQTLKHLGLTNVAHADVLSYFPRFTTLDDFLEAIGNTDISPQNITSKVAEHRQEELLPEAEMAQVTIPPAQPETRTLPTMQVDELSGFLTTLGRCCKPMPGDEVVGYITRGRGITVHRSDCPNLASVRDTDRLIRVSWGGTNGSKYPAGVLAEALDRVGLLRDVTTMLADEKVNLVGIRTNKRPGAATTTLRMTLEVSGVEQLYRLMDRISSIQGIFEVQRDTGGEL